MTGRRDVGRGASLALGLLVAAVCAFRAQPAPGPGDSAELATVALSWGVAHPTGYPLWTVIAHLWVLAFQGTDAATALAWMSAVFAGLAATLTAEVGAAHGSRAAGLLAALSFAFSPTAWEQGTNVEVYTLFFVFQAAEVLLLQRCLDARSPQAVHRALYGAALVGGLGATHHVMIGLLVPAALVVAWTRRRSLRWGDGLAAVGLALGPLALYALIPWRAGLSPLISWHRITDFRLLLVHATGGQYHGILQGPGAQAWPKLLLAMGGVGPLLVLVVLAGSALVRPRSGPRLLLALHLLATGLFGAGYAVVDQEVFFLPFVWALCVAAARGAWQLTSALPRARWLLFALPAAELMGASAPSLATHDEDLAFLQAAPPHAIAYLAGGDGLALLYPLLARGLRPDVEAVDSVMDARPRYPVYVDHLLGESLPAGRTAPEWILGTLLEAGLPIATHPRSVTPAVAGAHGVRVQAGVIDLIVPAGQPPGAAEPGCGRVRFEGATLDLPCGEAVPVPRVGLVSAPLSWQSPDASSLALVIVDAAAGTELRSGAARPVLQAPVGMGRSELPTDRAWTDPLWVAVPRESPAGPRALWIGLRQGDHWAAIEETSAPTQGPFVQLLAYTVGDDPPPELWTFPG